MRAVPAQLGAEATHVVEAGCHLLVERLVRARVKRRGAITEGPCPDDVQAERYDVVEDLTHVLPAIRALRGFTHQPIHVGSREPKCRAPVLG